MERLLPFGDEVFVAGGIDEGIWGAGFQVWIFFFEAEVAAVSAKEDVAGQGVQNVKHALEVFGDLGIGLVVDELVAGVDVGAADDDYVVGFAGFGHLHGPGGAALGVARGEVGDEDGAAEFHFIAIVQDAIDLCGRIEKFWPAAILKIGFAAGFDDGDVGIHDHVGCSGQLLDFGAAGVVVPVGVADQEDFCVFELEAELFDAGLEQRDVGFEIAVDKNVALRGGDEKAGQALAADVVEIAGDAEGRKGLSPRGIVLRECAA